MDLVHRFDAGLGDGNQTEYHRALFEQLQQTKVGWPVCVLDGDGIDLCQVERSGQIEIGSRIRLVDIFVWLIEVSRISATEMHNTLYVRRNACETPLEVVDSICQSFSRLAGEYRFVDLYVVAAGVCERQDLDIEGICEISILSSP